MAVAIASVEHTPWCDGGEPATARGRGRRVVADDVGDDVRVALRVVQVDPAVGPILTVTKFGTVCPGKKLRLETTDCGSPDGQAWMNPLVSGTSTVTFKTTAVAPVAGTPPKPATFNSVSACELSAEMLPPTPVRVSSSRAGFSGT